MTDYKTLEDINVEDKNVLVRVDYNLPLDEEGNITDEYRLEKSLETINHLIENNAKIVLMSHLGRPEGERDENLSMAKIFNILKEKIDQKCYFAKDCIGEERNNIIKEMNNKEVLILENLRYHSGEKDNSEEFAGKLAENFDLYINDAFGVLHRKHASIHKITDFLPSVAGKLVEKEIKELSKIKSPEKPFHMMIGGSKIKSKIKMIEELGMKADKILIGGALANSFLKAKGIEVGESKLEKVKEAKKILENFREKILLPKDVVVGKEFESDTNTRLVSVDKIKEDELAMDLGPETLNEYKEELQKAKTIFYNGPLGVTEFDKFSLGTKEILGKLFQLDSRTIVSGGNTASVVNKLGLTENFSHVSTGGGSSLKFLSGEKLPGIEALK